MVQGESERPRGTVNRDAPAPRVLAGSEPVATALNKCVRTETDRRTSILVYPVQDLAALVGALFLGG